MFSCESGLLIGYRRHWLIVDRRHSAEGHLLSKNRTLLPTDAGRLKRSLHPLIGFLLGCVVAACAVSVMEDWAWSLPVVLAAAAIAIR